MDYHTFGFFSETVRERSILIVFYCIALHGKEGGYWICTERGWRKGDDCWCSNVKGGKLMYGRRRERIKTRFIPQLFNNNDVFCERGFRQASWLLPAATNCHTCVNNIPTDDGGGKRGMEKGGAGDDNDDDDDD